MKFLVIRFVAIGDVMISSTLCNSLKKSFPDAQIDYMVYEICAPLFTHHPDIDNVIAVTKKQRKNPLRYLRLIRQLRQQNYDIIIDASSTAKSELISFFSKRSKYRIGRYKKRRGKSYTHRVDEQVGSDDKIEQRLSLLQPLKDEGLDIELDMVMRLHIRDELKEKMRAIMQTQGVDFSRKIMVFSVSSKQHRKKWRMDYLAEVARHCLDQYNAQIVLYAGSAQERTDVENFHHCLHYHPDVITQIPTPSLRELATLFSNCDFFFGNEGGPRHISQALDIPSLAIFSPSANKADWLPGNNPRYQGIDWMDTELGRSESHDYKFKNVDSYYYFLYHAIKPQQVIGQLDRAITQYLNNK